MSEQKAWTAFDRAVLSIAQTGASRCGAGFGKYPLGLRDALRELEPLWDPDSKAYGTIRAAIAQFEEASNGDPH